jgi:hypothetical protein
MHADGYHRACLLFPKPNGPALDELGAGIKDQWRLQPIVRLNDQVLDGKNRLTVWRILKWSPGSFGGTAITGPFTG